LLASLAPLDSAREEQQRQRPLPLLLALLAPLDPRTKDTFASFTVHVLAPITWPPLTWQSPGPAAPDSGMPMCIGIGTSTCPCASLMKQSSMAGMASATDMLATILS
jgi:hypothetical protein